MAFLAWKTQPSLGESYALYVLKLCVIVGLDITILSIQAMQVSEEC